ncbi:MAG: AgmX/PglI C-terminal domain-containing protein [Bradymonadales bacterium]
MNKTLTIAVALALLVVAASGGYLYVKYSEEAENAETQNEKTEAVESKSKLKDLGKRYDSPEEQVKMRQMIKDDKYIAPRIQVLFQVLKIEGAMSKVDVERSYLFQQSTISGCYLNALSDDMDLAGISTLHFEVEASGKVIKATHDSEIKHAGLSDCLQKAMESWPFASSSDGKAMTIDASLTFASAPPPTPEEILGGNKGHNHGHQH